MLLRSIRRTFLPGFWLPLLPGFHWALQGEVAVRDQFGAIPSQESGLPRLGGSVRWPARGSGTARRCLDLHPAGSRTAARRAATHSALSVHAASVVICTGGDSSQHKQVTQAVSNQRFRDRPKVAAVKAAWMVIGDNPNRARLDGIGSERPRREWPTSSVFEERCRVRDGLPVY